MANRNAGKPVAEIEARKQAEAAAKQAELDAKDPDLALPEPGLSNDDVTQALAELSGCRVTITKLSNALAAKNEVIKRLKAEKVALEARPAKAAASAAPTPIRPNNGKGGKGAPMPAPANVAETAPEAVAQAADA